MSYRPGPATWPIRPTRPPCPGPTAIGRACRSMMASATSSAGAVARWRSASKRRSHHRRREIENPAGALPAGLLFLPQRTVGRIANALILRRAALHVLEHGRGRPAVDLDVVRLLIRAERRAREHAGLAVDFVLVEAELGERALHGLHLCGAQLRVLAPRRLERPRIADALAQVPDEQHVEIGEIVFLDDVIVLEREERGPIGALGQQQRGGLVELGGGGLAPIGRRKALLEPFAERTRHLRHADGAVDALRRAHL